jgi:hypothetical protein
VQHGPGGGRSNPSSKADGLVKANCFEGSDRQNELYKKQMDRAVEKLSRSRGYVGDFRECLKGLLEVHDVPGDGNCFYHALAHQVQHKCPELAMNHRQLRNIIANEAEVARYIDWDFGGNAMGVPGHGKDLMVSNARRSGGWVDGQEFHVAAGVLLGCSIEIFGGNGFGKKVVSLSAGSEPTWVAQLGLVGNNHYCSLIRAQVREAPVFHKSPLRKAPGPPGKSVWGPATGA